MPLNAPRHNPLYVMLLSTICHVNIHQTIYSCLRGFSMTNNMLYLRVARHKILAVEIHVGSAI
jgi:hypothetical protein